MTKPIQDKDAEFAAFLKHEDQLAIDLLALGEDPPDTLTASILQRAQEKLDAEKRAEQSVRDEAARCEQLKAQQATLAAANDAQTPDEKAKPTRHYLREWPAMFAIAASLLLVISIGLRWQSESLPTDQQQIALASNTPPIQPSNQSASTLEKSANLPSPASAIIAESSTNDKAKQAVRSNADTESSALNRNTEEKAAQIALSEESRSKKIAESERLAEQAKHEKKASLASKPESIQLSAANLGRARADAKPLTEVKAQAPAVVALPPPPVEAPSAAVAEGGRSRFSSGAANSVADRQSETNVPAEPSELAMPRKSAQNAAEIGQLSLMENREQSAAIAQAPRLQKSAEKAEVSAREINNTKRESAATPLPAAAPGRVHDSYAIAPKERLQQIDSLIKQNRVEEARLAWRDFLQLFPGYSVPAALKNELERIEALKTLESSKTKIENDKK